MDRWDREGSPLKNKSSKQVLMWGRGQATNIHGRATGCLFNTPFSLRLVSVKVPMERIRVGGMCTSRCSKRARISPLKRGNSSQKAKQASTSVGVGSTTERVCTGGVVVSFGEAAMVNALEKRLVSLFVTVGDSGGVGLDCVECIGLV